MRAPPVEISIQISIPNCEICDFLMSSPALKAFIANESLGALPVNAFEIHSQKFELKWPSGGKELFG